MGKLNIGPVGYEYRSGRGDYAWGEWEKLAPRNPCTESVEDRVREIHEYIVRGYRYELRALYAGSIPDEVLTHNAKVTGSPALSASPSGLPGYATEVEK